MKKEENSSEDACIYFRFSRYQPIGGSLKSRWKERGRFVLKDLTVSVLKGERKEIHKELNQLRMVFLVGNKKKLIF